MASLHSIAVALDGSEGADRALEKSIELARLASAELSLVSVARAQYTMALGPGAPPPVPVHPDERRILSELLARAGERAKKEGVRSVRTLLLEGPVVDSLLSFFDELKPDLIVLGARGLSTGRRLFVGSVSEAVLHHAHGSVLIVRPPSRASRG